MFRPSIPCRVVLLVGVLSCFGCQGLTRILHRAGTQVRPGWKESSVVLAADFGAQSDQRNENAPPKDIPSDATAATEQEDSNKDTPSARETLKNEDPSVPNDRERDQAALPKRSYTSPSAEVRQVALARANPSVGDDDDLSSPLASIGREAAEAAAGSATPFVGQPGLSAPQPTVTGVVVSRPGLQEGPASGLGFASPFNILSPQTNPLSGVNGRCADLTRAGFFGGNRSACESHFRRP